MLLVCLFYAAIETWMYKMLASVERVLLYKYQKLILRQ